MSTLTEKTSRILIVDDETHILQVLSLKLRNAGYEVLSAGDGEEGLELALEELPDLIITDFQMPFMTGLEMCQALATNKETEEIPVIMLTARGHSLNDEDVSIGNIRHVVHKPFSPRAVLELVKSQLFENNPRRDSQSSDSEAA